MKQSANFKENTERWQNIKEDTTYLDLLSPTQKAIKLKKTNYSTWLTNIEKGELDDFYIHMYIGVSANNKASFYFIDSTYNQEFPPPPLQILEVPFKKSLGSPGNETPPEIDCQSAKRRHARWIENKNSWCTENKDDIVRYFCISSKDFKLVFYNENIGCTEMSLFFGINDSPQNYIEVIGANYTSPTPFAVEVSDKHLFVDVTTPCPPLC